MASEGGLKFALRALSHRNYRLFFAGQTVSLIGTWLTRIATSWLVYRLTGSATLLGVIAEGGCFLLDGISYVAVIGSLLAMKVRPFVADAGRKHVLHELRDGFRYAAGSGPIRAMLVLLSIVSLVGMPYTVLMPVMA